VGARAHTEPAGSSEMRRGERERFAIVVYRVEMDRARINLLVIGAGILGISGAAASNPTRAHAPHLLLTARRD
jgi:hypothetical protein